MSSLRYRADLSAEHHQAIATALTVRKVDLQLAARDAAARLERARAAQDDEAAVMAEEAVSVRTEELAALEAAQHSFLGARRSTDARFRVSRSRKVHR